LAVFDRIAGHCVAIHVSCSTALRATRDA